MPRTPRATGADPDAPPAPRVPEPGAVDRTAWLAGLAIVVVVAAGLRLWMPGIEIVTFDEYRWDRRSLDFRTALVERDWASAVAAPRGEDATQPGVTTMWTGALAHQVTEWWSGPSRLRVAHVLMGIWCSLWLVPFALATARLVGRRAALLAAGLLAVEPQLVGHSAILHTDALLAMTSGTAVVALLAALDALRREGPARWWRRGSVRLVVLAGVAGALALLTKVTAVLVLGPAAMVALVVHVAVTWRRRSSPPPWRPLAAVVASGAGAALVTAVAAWPALWVDPIDALTAAWDSTRLAGHPEPRLFLGEVIRRGDRRFYPVEAWFRASPWLLVGTGAALGWTILRRLRGGPRIVPRALTVGLLGAAVPYLVVISGADKQYGRYLLPLLPLGCVALGAVGARALTALGSQRVATAGAWTSFAVAAAWTLSWAPYPIAHVNPLVGGQEVAVRNIQLGWGEGWEVVLQRFRTHVADHGCPTWSAAPGLVILCPRTDFGWLDGDGEPPQYVLRYVFHQQARGEPAELAPYLEEHGTLLERVEVRGFPYAEMWALHLDEGDEPTGGG